MPIAEASQRRRKARVNIVLNTVKAMGKVEYRQLIGLMSVNHGFKPDLSRSYIRELSDAGYLIVNDGIVTLTEDYKKQIGLKEVKAKKELNDYDKSIQKPENN